MIRSRSNSPHVASALAFAIACGAGLAPQVAHADDRAEARRLFAQGEVAYEGERWDEALEAYSAAYAAVPLPGFLFNIGQCHRKLGHWDAAADFFRRYLEELPDAPNRADAEALLEEVHVRMAPPPPPPAPPPALPPGPRADAAPRGMPLRLLTWIALGAGVAFAGASIGFALDLSAAQSSFDDPSLDCAKNPDRCRSLRDRGDTAATARTVFAVGAAAALATCGLLLVLELGSHQDDPERTVLRPPRLGLGPTGFTAEVPW